MVLRAAAEVEQPPSGSTISYSVKLGEIKNSEHLVAFNTATTCGRKHFHLSLASPFFTHWSSVNR